MSAFYANECKLKIPSAWASEKIRNTRHSDDCLDFIMKGSGRSMVFIWGHDIYRFMGETLLFFNECLKDIRTFNLEYPTVVSHSPPCT